MCRPWRKPACPATTSACGSASWGGPGDTRGLWSGLRAPAATPQPIVDKLNKTANDALKSSDVVEPLHKIGMEIIGGTPQEFARYIDAEEKKATDVATAANIRQ